MNPAANEWKPSASAATWVPGGNFPVSAVPAPAPVAQVVAPPPPPIPPTVEIVEESLDPNIDENDPLWIAVLEIANNDRKKAELLLSDPDSLIVEYPHIAQIIEAGGTSNENDMGLTTEMEQKMNIDDTSAIEPIQEGEATSALAPTEVVSPDLAVANDAEPNDIGDDTTSGDVVAVKEGDPREHLTLVFIGHVDAGKSTLSGNILYLTDNVDKRTIERYEKEAKDRNRESWFLAFIMDTNEEERAKGITVEVGKAHFSTDIKRYTILDAPGHKNYVPNMIQGASQADVGILVISARKGEFETGFERGGQTREHAMLCKTLGVSYLIVAVNKMDEPTVQWKKERFEECVNKIRPFLKSCGYIIKKEVKFIPISGLGGANVKFEVPESVCSWWKPMYTSNENNTSSPTLLGLLDTLEMHGRDPDLPVRIPVLDRYSDRGTIAMGKVESGLIRPGMKVIVMPTNNIYKVDEVWANEDPVLAARPGENVLIKLNGAKMEDIRKGFVICTTPACRAVDKLICQIAIADMPESQKIMTAGFQCMFHAHTSEEECTVTKIFETTNAKGITMKGARFAGVGMKAIVMLQLAQTVSLEEYDVMAFLGRFTLRTEGKTVAIGKITKLPPKKD
jgi:peptide chain release factor subunit 3